MVVDLAQVHIEYEIAYPYSPSLFGVSVEDHGYGYNEIAKADSQRGVTGETYRSELVFSEFLCTRLRAERPAVPVVSA